MPFVDKPVIKVITGMRRIGKSCFLRQIIDFIGQKNVGSDQILYINKELLEFDDICDYRALNKRVLGHFEGVSGPKYLFIDEVQEIEGWERAVVSLLAQGLIDIYITGSNAHLFSSDLATLVSGRYIELPMYSLSLVEFLDFRDKKRTDANAEFQLYLRLGGFPGIHHFGLQDDTVFQYINALYSTIVLKDIVKRYEVRNVRLLEDLTRYVFDNAGAIFSARSIAAYLKSQRLKVGVETIQKYLGYLISSYMIYRVPRYDIKGKRLLEIQEKYYLGNLGLRHALLGYREADISGLLENVVFLELKRRGYTVSLGKFGNREVDFIAEKDNTKLYVQVTYLLSSPETVEREFSVLAAIKDNYPKYVLSLDPVWGQDYQGIQRVHLIDFLMSDLNDI